MTISDISFNIFLFFSYTLKVFINNFKNGLNIDDLPDIIKSCKSEHVGSQLEQQYAIEDKIHPKSSICRALVFCFWKHWAIVGVLQLLAKLTTTYVC